MINGQSSDITKKRTFDQVSGYSPKMENAANDGGLANKKKKTDNAKKSFTSFKMMKK